MHADLRELESSLAQRKLHLTWAGVKSAIDQLLLEAEAENRGMTMAELRASEIDAKVVPPPEEELRSLYDRNSERIGVPYEVAAPHLKREIVAQAREEVEQRFVAELREKATIAYSLPVPPMPRLTLDEGNGPAKGPVNAKVTIIEFSDFQCPYCGRASQVLGDLAALYPKDVRLVFRDFPLSQHPQARSAALAAECAHEQGKFWAYHDLLFDNANQLAPDELKGYASTVGLDLAAFESCLASERPAAAVAADEAAAERHGVDGTPALYLNGIKLIGLLPLPLMRALIENELRMP